jgi:hypothetical protein
VLRLKNEQYSREGEQQDEAVVQLPDAVFVKIAATKDVSAADAACHQHESECQDA